MPRSATVRSADGVAGAAQLACVLEVSAEKPGNVTPSHDFDDMSFEDMLRSAVAIGPELGRAGERGVGETILAAVNATRRVAPANTNLGIVLLLAPLAKAALGGAPVGATLRALDLADARAAYEAIRLADAGGLGEPVEHDVRDEPDRRAARGDGERRGAGLDRLRVRDRLRADVRDRLPALSRRSTPASRCATRSSSCT